MFKACHTWIKICPVQEGILIYVLDLIYQSTSVQLHYWIFSTRSMLQAIAGSTNPYILVALKSLQFNSSTGRISPPAG